MTEVHSSCVSSTYVERANTSQRSRGRPFARRAIADDEVSTARACKILGFVHISSMPAIRHLPREQVRLFPNASGRPTWAYKRVDVERIHQLRTAAGITLGAAVRVRLAELAGKL